MRCWLEASEQLSVISHQSVGRRWRALSSWDGALFYLALNLFGVISKLNELVELPASDDLRIFTGWAVGQKAGRHSVQQLLGSQGYCRVSRICYSQASKSHPVAASRFRWASQDRSNLIMNGEFLCQDISHL
jgi:hypothetical protein